MTQVVHVQTYMHGAQLTRNQLQELHLRKGISNRVCSAHGLLWNVTRRAAGIPR